MSTHLLTIDVEQWGRGIGPEARTPAFDLRGAMEEILLLLADEGVSATFFVLGRDAAALREVLPRCLEAGHEVGCHGMEHQRVAALGPDGFRRDLREALAVIGDIVQVPCRGYRAPYFSASPAQGWFFEILAEEGFVYDASLRLPPGSGTPEACRRAGLKEVPAPMVSVGPWRVGALGGLALRLFSRGMLSRLIGQCEKRGEPACVYLHPYEWRSVPSPDSRPSLSLLRRRLLVSRTMPKLRWLIRSFEMTSVERWLEQRG